MPVKDLVDEYEAKHQKSKKKTKIPKTVEILSDTSLNDEKPKKTIKENLFKKTTPPVPIKLSKKKISKREMSPKTPIKTKTKPIIQKMKRKVRGTKEVFEISSSEKHENSIESIHSFKEEEKKISEKKIPESKKIFSKVSSSRHSISKIKMGKRKFSNEKIEKAPTKKIKIDSNTIIEKETKVKEPKPHKEKEKEKDQKEIKEIKENDKSVKKNHFLKKSSRKEIKTLKKTRAEPEKSETAENLKEKIEKSLNLIKTNKTFGHFDHGDKAKRIISAKPEKNDVMCAIEWEPREDGFQPVTSHISNSIIKERDPLLLIRFYESKLKFETGKEEKREEKKEKEDKDRIEDKITTDQSKIKFIFYLKFLSFR